MRESPCLSALCSLGSSDTGVAFSFSRPQLLTVWIDSDHIAELNNTAPKQPFFFLKPASSLLIPGAGPILRPKGVSLHYEVELGLVIGKTVRDLDPNDEKGALDAIQSKYSMQSGLTGQNRSVRPTGGPA